MLDELLIAYIALISVVSCIVCIYDKLAAKHTGTRRIRESTLLLLSAVGGSVAMFATMQIIRHKTLHVKFMVGIPLIIMAQVFIAYVLLVLL